MRIKPGYDEELHRRSKECIAQGALTNSKRPQCLVEGIYPTHLTRGQGALVWDASGNKYVDFIGGLGSNLLGYGHEEVTRTIAERASQGCTLSLGSTLEIEAAEKVKDLFPFIERVKFLKTGSEACSAAIRIARTYTRRFKVYTQGYHGWHDEFVSLTPPALGVPFHGQIEPLPFHLADISADAAAVILEPVSLDCSPDRIKWLRALKALCNHYGILLIFDEIITGFRFPKYSVANHFGIEPDLICLGKSIANGMAVSVVGGRAQVMNCDEYFVSSTFAGETVSLAAALKTMELVQTKYNLTELWARGDAFCQAFNAIWPEGLHLDGYATRAVFKGDDQVKALFWQEAVKAGILFGPSWFYSFPHQEHTDMVLNVCQDILSRIRNGQVTLEGKLPQSPFANRMRNIQ